MGMRLIGLILIVLAPVSGSLAQVAPAPSDSLRLAADSVRTLREVQITDRRLNRFAGGDKIVPLHARAIGPVDYANLSELLTTYSGLNVRSYGPSGLATASLRGTGSNHTAVFWEGINLQSSMNGSLDLTLMPVSFVDEVAVQYGSSGALFGSGTLGGAIHLSSDTPSATLGWNSRLYQQAGSFGRCYTGLNAGYRSEKWATQVRTFAHRADYDFSFYNPYTNREEHRRNAGIDQQGVLIENQWTPTTQHTLRAKYWYQDNQAQIPDVASGGGETKATQADAFHRATVHWTYRQRHQEWQIRTALLHHRLVYDDKIRTLSTSRATSWITEAENTYYLNEENWLHTGLNYTYETASVDSYAEPVQRHRTALFLSYRTMLLPSLEATVGARETLIDGRGSPFLPSLGLRYSLSPVWSLRAKTARSYRIPTFNDLYWAGAGGQGNPDLLPETGWSHELGLRADAPTTGLAQGWIELTAFSNSVHQWIGWVPLAGNVWTPINVEQVWARGGEISGFIRQPIATSLSAQLQASYSYTKSTKERIAAGGKLQELHKQLIYTPYHQTNASLTVECQSLRFGYSVAYVGEQFTSASNSRTLPAYGISNVSVTYRWPIHPKHQVLISGQVSNLTNQDYYVRQGYPMPGRNYQLSFIYQFN